ncbi:RagB/SusD family nutrient uptake outer membrane protein [Snuella sedimenti]|uniref:RagB/SusD family nutrient uptake outer membrane protein n=1 Tax=Snuella sedimenti TaxID=2798802 RepID=A0A8J7J6V9_9FLAO|nr:RagB/SusD family nutrient uptake outer membrane protein [Snuella sedimenti]MBJ6369599.1 RagB/SusD family nutrient uptake outer membrane protein [Snuella sedimenti]
MKTFKKNLFAWFVCALVVLSNFSCSDDALDKKPLDAFSEADIWADAQLAEGFILTLYNNALSRWIRQETDDWTDNIVPNDDNGGSRHVQQGNVNINEDYGWNRFGVIRAANLAIARISASNSIDENTRKKLVAEAKALRAMTYFWQARRFGGLIIVDKVLTPDDDLELPRSSERETYNFIIQDLEEAVLDLPVDVTTGREGRLNKGAAYAFLTMVALQIGDYDKVISAANEVETLGYSLDPVYKNMFNSYAGTKSSPENILVYSRGEDFNNYINTRMFRNLVNVSNGRKLHATAVPQFNDDDLFEAWPLRWPSQELVDAYLVKDGTERKGLDNQGMPSKDFYANRDDRFEQSIVRDSAQYRNSIFTFRRGGNSHWTSNPQGSWGMSKTGYMFRKWMYEEDFIFWNLPVNWAEPILRLGEVYLNKAEAYARKSDLPNAVKYLNMTRETHGGLPPLSSGVSETEFWKYYDIERRVELVMEDDYYWSLIRWARAENRTTIPQLSGKLHGLDMELDGLINVIESPWSVELNFKPQRLLFPVPDSQIRTNSKLAGAQNPGW